MEKEQKKSREREANWANAEKEFLRECINLHVDIVEHKGNDVSMIQKKKNAWKAIQAAMASGGYQRDIIKLKSQWIRMKVSARKAVAVVKRASVATGNCVGIPEISAEDNLVQGMILHEFEEDDILIDSNCTDTAEYLECELKNSPNVNYKDIVIELDESPSTSQQCFADAVQESKNDVSPTTTPLKSIYNSKSKKNSPTSNIQRLRRLPKTPSKANVILERQRQITKETLHSEEIYKLQKQQLESENEYKKLLYTLELKRLQKQMDYDAELHDLKIQILTKNSANQILF